MMAYGNFNFPLLFLVIFSILNLAKSLPTTKTIDFLSKHKNLKDAKHGVKMGESETECDDGKGNLEIDWDGSPLDYICYQKIPFPIDKDKQALIKCKKLKDDYLPQHFCMKDKINYNETLPTHGDHRPLWPVFGEYTFLPIQRWLHSIEHGAIVMLYHPCAHPMMIDKLKKLLTNCLRKHIITADSNRLTEDRPLALIAWGCKFEMNFVDAHQVINFIRKHALHGPEGKLAKEGQFNKNLIQKAQIPIGSNYEDDILCPSSF